MPRKKKDQKKKPQKVIRFDVDLPEIRTFVTVIVAPTEKWPDAWRKCLGSSEEGDRILKEVTDDNPPADAFYLSYGGAAAIFLQPDFSVSAMVHEAVHVGLSLLKERGFKDANTEAEAYLISYVCEQILKKMKRKA